MPEPAPLKIIPFDRDAFLRPNEGPLTEDSAAQLFAERYSGSWRYCHSSGRWHGFDGAIWRPDGVQRAFHDARVLARDLRACAKGQELGAGKVAFAAAMERAVRADPAIARQADDWDQDPLLLGTPGGTVDLRTGVIRPADPDDMITKAAAVAPADRADCPRWRRFLDEATDGDAGLVRFLQQTAGYCLTGLTSEHALFFLYGLGGNGKSVAVNTLAGVFGDYAVTAAMETFAASKSDRHPTDLAMLRGARLVTASETEEGRAWAESRIKQMTGGDRISARFMRQDFFEYTPQFKLLIIGNHKPLLRSVDDAARRRFNILPFVVKPAEPDRRLEEKLKAEWPAILRWMIDGCLDWRANGLQRPPIVAEATESYFADQDTLGHWLEEECDAEPGNPYKWETGAKLFARWSAYAKAAGEDPGTSKAFNSAMQSKGMEPHRTKHARTFRGVCFREGVTGDA